MKIDFNEKVGAKNMTRNSLPTIRRRKLVARSMTRNSLPTIRGRKLVAKSMTKLFYFDIYINQCEL